MSRRSLSSILVFGLLVVLFVVAVFVPVPYVTMSPGPTINVLGETSGKTIVSVHGHRTYPTTGQLRMTTVSVTSPGRSVNLVGALRAWFDKTRAVYPRDVIYPPQESAKQAEKQSTLQMRSSQDSAVAAALGELGYHTVGVEVRSVGKGTPARGKLRVHDRILSVNDTKITKVRQVSNAIQRTGAGTPAHFVVRRAGKSVPVVVVPHESTDKPKRAVVGITIAPALAFPFDVSVRLSERITGPSAGLIFALAVYDTLTPGDLTGGAEIAGTGTITPDGRVGPIGGIQQKIVGAAAAGAKVFLVPPDDCGSALHADVRKGEVRLVKAPTLHSAISSLRSYAHDPSAALPRCR